VITAGDSRDGSRPKNCGAAGVEKTPFKRLQSYSLL